MLGPRDRRDNPDIYLFRSRQPYTGDEARPKIDHAPIDTRHVLVGIKHGPSSAPDPRTYAIAGP